MSNVTGGTLAAPHTGRPLATAAVIFLTFALGACSQKIELGLGLTAEKPKTTDIATASAGERPEAELEKATAYWGEQFNKNPRDPKAAISYARNLKALGRKAQALGVMQASYTFAPDDKDFLSEYGRLALEMGQVSTAGELLARADDPGKPDWKLLSARGAVMAKQGRLTESIQFLEKARSLAPGQASVMNNLAMAYAMDGQAARGEALLREAAGTGTPDPRVQKNLALVVELQSKSTAETKGVAEASSAVAEETGPQATVTPIKLAAWDNPLPIEAGRTAGKAKASPGKAAAAPPLDPDEIVRQAMAAEAAKAELR